MSKLRKLKDCEVDDYMLDYTRILINSRKMLPNFYKEFESTKLGNGFVKWENLEKYEGNTVKVLKAVKLRPKDDVVYLCQFIKVNSPEQKGLKFFCYAESLGSIYDVNK